MTSKIKVFLTGGDKTGWALDIDLRHTKLALPEIIEYVDDIADSDVVHSVNIENLFTGYYRKNQLDGKIVITHFTSNPVSLFEMFPDLFNVCRNWICIAQSKEAYKVLVDLQLPFVFLIPYIAHFKEFYAIHNDNIQLKELRNELNLPHDKYIIGLFQRDSLGADLSKFKPQKGADIFMSILVGLKKRIGVNSFHVLLTGPRRHWLRKKLDEYHIGYTFDGVIKEEDDYPENIVSIERLNLLTNLIDLYIIPSRWEGAPHALFETILCDKKLISTPIAVPNETLPKQHLFSSIPEAIDIVKKDFETNFLNSGIKEIKKTIQTKHGVENLKKIWSDIYGHISDEKGKYIFKREDTKKGNSSTIFKLITQPKFVFSKLKNRKSSKITITLWGPKIDGPYGGGNQMFKAIETELQTRGIEVLFNSNNDSDAHFLNSAWFDVKQALKIIPITRGRNRVIHRIDGPICHYRGSNNKNDEIIFSLNNKIATVTAFQSYYSWLESIKLGFNPINPMIIRNSSNPSLFFPNSKMNIEDEKVIIISSSWSNNFNKGFETYKYLDENLDFSIIKYYFVGNSPIEFNNIKIIPPLNSMALGEKLRNGHIYITASINDPASNSLSEAIISGLPAIHLKSGGHSEIANFAGLGFNKKEEIPELLEQIIENYEAYKLVLYHRTIKEITDSYLNACGLNLNYTK